MKKVLYIFCIFAVMMLQVSCDNKSNEIKSQVVEDTSNSVTSNENYLEDETIANNKSITKEEVSVNDETIQLGEIVDSGDCGESATWKLDEYGTLVISGTGELYDFTFKQDLVKFEIYQDHECTWDDYNDYIKSIVVEEGITKLQGNSFCLPNLVNVKLPNSLKKIEGNMYGTVFKYCTNLKNITFPNNLTTLKYAFYECGLIDISFPNSLIEIGESAVSVCENLISVNIPDSVETINRWAFCNDINLKNIQLSKSLQSIEPYAFSGCTSLENIELPNSVIYVGDRAFSGCTNLKFIKIPKNVTEIGHYAFSVGVMDDESSEPLDITIQGVIGSCAQKYAEENDINFEVMNNPN